MMRSPLLAPLLIALCAATHVTSAHAAEKRVVTYVDGDKPRLEAAGTRYVRGPLALELVFQNTNPLCYRYATNIAKLARGPNRAAARPSAVTPVAPATFNNADEALTALRAANEALEQVAREARQQASLDAMWAECLQGGNFALQRARVEAASSALERNLAPGGAWQQALTQAGAAARGALAFARPLADAAATAQGAAPERREAVERAERQLAQAREALARSQRKPPRPELQQAVDSASADLEAARRTLEEADKSSAQSRAAPHVVETAERLAQRRNKVGQLLDRLNADAAQARALVAAAPASVTRSYASGETVHVTVVRTPLVHGEAVAGATTETTATELETLSPIILDVGFGPAITLGQNSEEYELTVVDSAGGGSRIAAARTEEKLILDGIVSFSAYLWNKRYLDDTVFNAENLIPRPMFALSMEQPFESIYAGLQVDPIQFVDISGGVRWMTTKKVIGQKVDQDNLAQVSAPQTSEEVTPLGFVAITFSTDLFWRWAKRQVKDIAD
jgi:hypothetical protein